MSFHSDLPLPGHLAQLIACLGQTRRPTVQQEVRDGQLGTLNHLASMATAWLPVIVLLMLSGCTWLLPLHLSIFLQMFTQI